MACPIGDSREGAEPDTDDDFRPCRKNSPSLLSCMGKRTKVAVTVASKTGQFTADKQERTSSSVETEGI